jgi:predicted ester cyclase
MSTQDNLKLDQESIAALNAHDIERGLKVLSDDVVSYDSSSPTPRRGKEANRKNAQAWFTAFPDIQVVVKNRVVSDDQVAGEVEFTGTHTGSLQFSPDTPAIAATGKKITGKGTYFNRIRNGKFIEQHTYPDVAGMMMQLGQTPAPSKN